MIAQLKAENFEYRQKEKDYNTLHNMLLDLERRFRLLQEEKTLAERESHEREDLHYKRNEELHNDIRNLKVALDDKQKELKTASADWAAYKGLTEDKALEVSQLKKELANRAADNVELLRAKKNLEADLGTVLEAKKATHAEADRIALLNDRVAAAEAQTAERLNSNRAEAGALQRKIDGVTATITDLGAVKKQRDLEIGAALEGKRSNRNEADRLLSLNGRLQEDNGGLEIAIKDTELRLASQKQKLSDTLVLLSANDKEVLEAKSNLSYTDGQALNTLEQARKVQRDNEVLQSLLDKYRNDVDLQRRLRLAETSKKLELEQEKKMLEREVINKQLEAHSAQKQLQRVHLDKDRLLDDHEQLNQELGAVKEHAELLESQNFTVCPSFRTLAPS